MSKILDSGHTFEDVTGAEAERLSDNYFYYSAGATRLKPGNWLFPSTFPKYANGIYNFEIKPTDIFVETLPKSGTNWIQEIVWNLVHNPDLDNPDANITIDARCPFYEIDLYFAIPGAPPMDLEGEMVQRFYELCPGKQISDGLFIHLAAFAPEPRLLKNHLPVSLLPPDVLKKAKVIYLARDPRDVIISNYNFCKLHSLVNYKGNLADFVEDYVNDRNLYGPHWEHVRQAWEKRNHPNFLFLYYEDLKADAKSVIKRIDKFIGTNRTDPQIDNIVDYTNFANMKERTKDNPPTSYDNAFFNKDVAEQGGTFFRKGQVGAWKEELTPELQEKVNAWMSKYLPLFSTDFKYKVQ